MTNYPATNSQSRFLFVQPFRTWNPHRPEESQDDRYSDGRHDDEHVKLYCLVFKISNDNRGLLSRLKNNKTVLHKSPATERSSGVLAHRRDGGNESFGLSLLCPTKTIFDFDSTLLLLWERFNHKTSLLVYKFYFQKKKNPGRTPYA